METALVFELPVAGKEVKLLIDRHCKKELVFYSVEVVADGQTIENQFMTFSKEQSTYKFVPSPTPNVLLDKEEFLSGFIMQHFHNHCLN